LQQTQEDGDAARARADAECDPLRAEWAELEALAMAHRDAVGEKRRQVAALQERKASLEERVQQQRDVLDELRGANREVQASILRTMRAGRDGAEWYPVALQVEVFVSLNPRPGAQCHKRETLSPNPEPLNFKPETRSLKPETHNAGDSAAQYGSSNGGRAEQSRDELCADVASRGGAGNRPQGPLPLGDGAGAGAGGRGSPAAPQYLHHSLPHTPR
jgi:hypothetical protein